MPIILRWTGEADRERIVRTRLRCYAWAGRDHDRLESRLVDDPRSVDGDFLLAEEPALPGAAAEAVGTLTSLSLKMWIRGCAFGCQGIAWVGTVRTHRRQGSEAGSGIASQLMHEALAKAREREEVVSALMPFRASFYQHFGYGIVETRNVWTVPLSILPGDSCAGIRYARQDDAPAIASIHQRNVAAGQCDIERGEARFRQMIASASEDGFIVVDPRPDGAGLRGYLAFQHTRENEKDLIDVTELVAPVSEGADALRRQLQFLASQRDQFASAILRLPVDLPLTWLLRESQIAHRPVNHPAATLAPHTRMQLRVLDHARLLKNIRLQTNRSGKATVIVKETEGHESRLPLDIADGRVSIAKSGGPAFTCADHTWSSIVCGALRASTAWRLGLAEAEHPAAAETLDLLASPEAGPMPYSMEYF